MQLVLTDGTVVKITVVDDPLKAYRTNQMVQGHPCVAVDFETEGCDPSDFSAVGTAEIRCMTLAFWYGGNIHAYYVPEEYVNHFEEWLTDPYLDNKVGAGVFGFDCHAVRNRFGLTMSGIIGDTVHMARFLGYRECGLKAQTRRLGYVIQDYKRVLQRRKAGAVKSYKRDRMVTDDNGVTTHYVAGAEYQALLKGEDTIPLSQLHLYPEREKRFKHYAVMDAVYALIVYGALKEEMDEVTIRPIQQLVVGI